MSELQKETIIDLVNIVSKKASITDQEQINETINRLCSMNIDDAIDAILVSLNDLLDRNLLTKEEIFANIPMIISLNPEKYASAEDLIERLNWLKGMNIEHPAMPLTENHKLVIDAFDNFNALVQDKFDCYYTGGLMGYLATNHELERYHGDLDLFINEDQLIALKKLVDASSDFEFVSNFERKLDNSITVKEYYFENQNTQGQLFVDEHHFTKEYTDMSFSNLVRQHNGIPYKMLSLESIYNSKKDGRPKDKYDANVIKDYVDISVDYRIDAERKNNVDVKHKPVQNSVVHTVENVMVKEKNKISSKQTVAFSSKITSNRAFDQRSDSEIKIAQQIREKNKVIANQKKTKQMEKPKTLVKTNTKPTSTSKGYIDVVVLSLIVSFVAGMLSVIVYLSIR